MNTQPLKIAVIGAGISGLTFAAAMRRFCPEARVELYERDQSALARPQGYSLGIKGDGGWPVLTTLGLGERLAGEATLVTNFIFCDQRGRPLLELPARGDEKRLTHRVRRQALMTALLEAASDTPIHHGWTAKSYRQQAGEVEVQFDNGQTVRADHVIGSEGVSSAIRQQMLGDARRYLGLTAIVGDAPITLQHPLLKGGYFLTLGNDGASVLCYAQPDSTHFSCTAAVPEHALDAHTPTQLLARVQNATRGWHAPIPEIAAALDPAGLVARGYYDREPARRVRDGRVWLIGDAAHPMSPFQGQGANMGMVDSLKLAEFFAAAAADPSSSEAQAGALEAEIVARGRKAVLDSRGAAKQFHVASRLRQTFRNAGFRMGNVFINLASR